MTRAERLRWRGELLWRLRGALTAEGFVEATTPVRIVAPAPEEYIDALPCGERWLRCSPELEMKGILAAGLERIYQVGPCFRLGEHGRLHREEFTMLEWYVAGADYRWLMAQTRRMLRATLGDCIYRAGKAIRLDGDWQVLPVRDAFARHAGLSVADALAQDRFDELMVAAIEPRLGLERPTFLIDYPIERAALARPCADDPAWAERWELYLGGVELANAFGELTDPIEQRRRFAQANAFRRRQGRPEYPLNETFLAALEGLGQAAGAALGFDRLVMLALDCEDIAQVL